MDQLQIVGRTASGLNVLGTFDLSRNPNILHNWDFTNPVNQRGETTYLNTSAEIPTIDRWRAGANMEVKIVSGGIKLTGMDLSYRTFRQTIENPERLAGKTVTVSLNILACTGKFTSYFVYPNSQSGDTTSHGIVFEAGTTGIKKYTVTLPSAANMGDTLKLHIGSSNNADVSLTLASVKLEIGAVSTLKDTDVADYAEQKNICERFLIQLTKDSRFRVEYRGLGASKVFHFLIPITTSMRISPTIEDPSALSLKTLSGGEISNVSIANIIVLRNQPAMLIKVETDVAHGQEDCLLYILQRTYLNAEL